MWRDFHPFFFYIPTFLSIAYLSVDQHLLFSLNHTYNQDGYGELRIASHASLLNECREGA